jgi:hypothetical protein
MNLLVDLQYFPSVELYRISNKFTDIVFEQYENYQKMSFRNRCQIAGAAGVISLSVPLLKGRDQRALMKDVKIAGFQPWQAQHWKTIVSCYNRSPWFEFYRDQLEELYQRRVDFLLDWNLACFEWTIKVLKMPLKVSLTDRYLETLRPEEGEDWRGKMRPKDQDRTTGPEVTNPEARGSARGQAGPTEPARTGHAGPLRYRQVFEERTGFLPNLSILDLLFCEGKEAITYIRS